ncbi:MAG: methyltransferase domain-containing protein [Polyangiaceae bacterium]|nr:methyltransferase domain-containing protein [Polyangiaceae bacterium]
MSVLHVTYLVCIRPYVVSSSTVLEIGPGRGAWKECFLEAREVWAIDALDGEYNGFNEYVGIRRNVRYLQVRDFEARELPDDYFDYMFSFGAVCHVSFEGMARDAETLFEKLRPGAECFWMIAD